MTGNRRVTQEVPATDKFLFLYGAFTSDEWRIPYLMTTMTYEQAQQYLRLSDEFVNSDEIAWEVDELYQRNIDWTRVQREIVKYLQMTGQPQFFNSLTVALLPMVDGQPSLHGSFDDGEVHWDVPPLGQTGLEPIAVGPIAMGFFDDFDADSGEPASGVVRWNPREVHAVAIDGQHRLAAIKELVSSGVSPAAARTRVPVLLLVLNEALGYRKPEDGSLVTVLRKLFIDLNKNAQKVNRARQILLDDRDPMSVFVRHVLTESLSEDLDALHDARPRLPLCVVDWHSEQAKFESGPYVTTVIGLDGMVGKIFQDQKTPDLTDYEGFDKQIAKFEKFIPGADVTQIKATLAERRESGAPFTYEPEWIADLGLAFASCWNRAITTLLSEFSPYKGLLQKRAETGTLDLKWQNWYRKQDAVGKQISGREFEDLERYKRHLQALTPPVSLVAYSDALRSLEALKRNLAFTVVFQRAYMDAFLEFRKLQPVHFAGLQEWASGQSDDSDVIDISGITLEQVTEESLVNGDAEVEDDAEEEAFSGAQPATTPDREGETAQLFVDLLNEVLDRFPEFLQLNAVVSDGGRERVSLWSGSFRAGSKIDYSKGASTRAKDLLFLAVTFAYLRRYSSQPRDFDDLWTACLDQNPPNGLKYAASAIRRLWSVNPKGVALRVLEELDAEELDEAARQEVARQKLQGLWRQIST